MHSNKSVANLVLFGLILQMTAEAVLADVSHLNHGLEYSITPSAQVAYYHYPAPRSQQQQQQQRQHLHHQQQVARQFVAPDLDHAAFTQALTSSGYVFGGNTAAASAPLTAALQPSGRSIGSPAAHTDANSLNLKLPVPFGVMPLNIAHLPLQAGASYATVPHTTGITSYGTAQLQRR